jgi:hypothetical protein
MLRLRKLPGVNRPAIACLWPSRNPGGFNVMLDVGADVKADADDLLQYAFMGASYARNGLGSPAARRPAERRHRRAQGPGRAEEAHDRIAAAPRRAISTMSALSKAATSLDRVDVIVTDGFTGNVALKTGEGTAKLISRFPAEAFNATPLSRIARASGADLAAPPAEADRPAPGERRRVPGPERHRGQIARLGRCHRGRGGDRLAYQLAQARFIERLAARVASPNARGRMPRNGGHDRNGEQHRMTIRAVVRGVGHYLPDRVVPNRIRSDCRDVGRMDPLALRDRTAAFRGRGPDHLRSGHPRGPAALADAGIDADDIDAIIVATSTPDLTFPAVGHDGAGRTRDDRGFAFDVQAVCAGFVFALANATR